MKTFEVRFVVRPNEDGATYYINALFPDETGVIRRETILDELTLERAEALQERLSAQQYEDFDAVGAAVQELQNDAI